jgi:hypothetical protein
MFSTLNLLGLLSKGTSMGNFVEFRLTFSQGVFSLRALVASVVVPPRLGRQRSLMVIYFFHPVVTRVEFHTTKLSTTTASLLDLIGISTLSVSISTLVLE